jgi:hypothetical protein
MIGIGLPGTPGKAVIPIGRRFKKLRVMFFCISQYRFRDVIKSAHHRHQPSGAGNDGYNQGQRTELISTTGLLLGLSKDIVIYLLPVI